MFAPSKVSIDGNTQGFGMSNPLDDLIVNSHFDVFTLAMQARKLGLSSGSFILPSKDQFVPKWKGKPNCPLQNLYLD